MLQYLRLLLFPFSILYGLVVVIRNKFYDLGLFKSVKFDLPVICVGNLAVGGSGKTPVTEYLVRLMPQYKIAILSRGYGRKTTGFLLADQRSTAAQIGDEPMQYLNKFPDVTVAVCEDRVTGIRKLEAAHDLIILDDAFQHRKVKPGFSLLLFDFRTRFRTQWLLPAGNMREPFSGHRRADIVLITKSPDQLTTMQAGIARSGFDENIPVFFAGIGYGDLQPLNGQKPAELRSDSRIILLTGIANPEPLVRYLSECSTISKHFDYPDHYQFKVADVEKVVEKFRSLPGNNIIVTTEKDAQRLLTGSLNKILVDLPVYFLPIRVTIQPEARQAFDKKITDYVASTSRNRRIPQA